jgi:hypothetical protein
MAEAVTRSKKIMGLIDQLIITPTPKPESIKILSGGSDNKTYSLEELKDKADEWVKKPEPVSTEDIIDVLNHITRITVADKKTTLIWSKDGSIGYMKRAADRLTTLTQKIEKAVKYLKGALDECDPDRMDDHINKALALFPKEETPADGEAKE